MDSNTQYASPERSGKSEISEDFKLLSSERSLLDILGSVSGITAILNENRQIVYTNDEFLNILGVNNLELLLGKRVGEVVACVHSGEMPSGCGTSKSCSVCGAVNAIIESQKTRQKSTREAMITSDGSGKKISWELKVTSSPVKLRGKNFFIFSVQDISNEKRRQNLERIFFHDILNTAGNLNNLLSIIKDGKDPEEVRALIDLSEKASRELIDEIMLHRQIRDAENGDLVVKIERASGIDVLRSSVEKISRNDIAKDKIIEIVDKSYDAEIKTDIILLQRILINLLKNALEATRENDKVQAEISSSKEIMNFTVRNNFVIPPDVQIQIFSRSFTTKGKGRGLGTYSIRMLTENYLGGKVHLLSNEKEGTIFTVELPLDGPK